MWLKIVNLSKTTAQFSYFLANPDLFKIKKPIYYSKSA